jgi:hypothetical protein
MLLYAIHLLHHANSSYNFSAKRILEARASIRREYPLRLGTYHTAALRLLFSTHPYSPTMQNQFHIFYILTRRGSREPTRYKGTTKAPRKPQQSGQGHPFCAVLPLSHLSYTLTSPLPQARYFCQACYIQIMARHR